MRYLTIKYHLRPYEIVSRRRTTINHAFAAAVAPNDTFDDAQVREAMRYLGQDPDRDLECVYCGGKAETWDHVHATVSKSQFSGHGHRIGNLLPCCKPCNSRKGNKTWQSYLKMLESGADGTAQREAQIAAYLKRYSVIDCLSAQSDVHAELDKIRVQIFELLEQADRLARRLRIERASESEPAI